MIAPPYTDQRICDISCICFDAAEASDKIFLFFYKFFFKEASCFEHHNIILNLLYQLKSSERSTWASNLI